MVYGHFGPSITGESKQNSKCDKFCANLTFEENVKITIKFFFFWEINTYTGEGNELQYKGKSQIYSKVMVTFITKCNVNECP